MDELKKAMKSASEAVLRHSGGAVSIYHHNDADGLSSGAILTSAFRKAGFAVSGFALEKPYPRVLERIFTKEGEILIFADFAGKIAPLINDMNADRNLVLILDHHPANRAASSRLFNLDAELFGLKGDRDISASALCALFAEVLLKTSGVSEPSLAHLGVLGAVGDGFLVDGCLSGFNRTLLKAAEDLGQIRTENSEFGEVYFITLGGEEIPALDVCESLDLLGGAGYYRNGPEKGVDICLNGFSSDSMKDVDGFRVLKDGIFKSEIEKLKENLVTTRHLQWFNVEERFVPMGVKMIGVFCTILKDRNFLDPTKYLAGFQRVPNQIPGFGNIELNAVKISMRVSSYLTDKIRRGEVPGLSEFLPDATLKLGGFVDACHGLSAATTVRIGEEQKLIDEIESELDKRMGVNG